MGKKAKGEFAGAEKGGIRETGMMTLRRTSLPGGRRVTECQRPASFTPGAQRYAFGVDAGMRAHISDCLSARE
jgi:hypothetical protein